MSTFYTCVDRYSNDILFRGYKNGKAIKERIKYKPTFYVPGKNWVVNHIDHDLTNYEVSNCEWVTQKENCKDKKDSIKEQQKIKFIFS
jgi:hypothetical protein